MAASVFDKVMGREDGDRPFLLGDAGSSYGQIRSHAEKISKLLRGAGCLPGSRVAVCFDQGAEYSASLFGIWLAGGISVLMAPDWTDDEKNRVLDHAEVRLALADTPSLGGTVPLRAAAVEGLDATLQEYDRKELESAQTGDAVIIYTSGTTGKPKGVVLTTQGVTANAAAVASYLGLSTDDRAPVFTPTCYAYSLSQNLSHAWAGAALLPVPSGLMFPREILLGISTHGLTGVSGTPTVYRILSELDPEAEVDLHCVRYVMTGGQPLHDRLVTTLRSLFPSARVLNMYGCSENSPRASYHWVDGASGRDADGYYAVGKPVEGTQIKLAPAATPSGPEGTGEVLISGTSLMRGYWKDPESTVERIRDGWFHTRDLGRLDAEGCLHLSGRASTIINVGNEKVSPEEVERILLEVPGVREAAVYGAPDELLGESVHAKIVTEPGESVQAPELQRHCRKRVSGFKVPRRILVVDEIPKTLYGKVDRGRLQEEARSEASRGEK